MLFKVKKHKGAEIKQSVTREETRPYWSNLVEGKVRGRVREIIMLLLNSLELQVLFGQ